MNVGKSFAKRALKNVETSLVLVVRVEFQSTFLMPEVKLYCSWLPLTLNLKYCLLAAQEIRDLPVRCNKFKDGCLWKGSVGTLSAHMQSCEFDLVPCKYKYIGCEVKMNKKDMEKHQQQEDGHHLHLALQSVVVPTISEGQSYIFELTDYTKKKENNEVFISDPFYTHHKGYKMCVKVYANGTGSGTGSHLSASLCVLQGLYDKNLTWPVQGGLAKLDLLNQFEDGSHNFVSVNFNQISQKFTPGKLLFF